MRVEACDGGLRGAGGARRDRTADLYNAIVALSRLSYGPAERGTLGEPARVCQERALTIAGVRPSCTGGRAPQFVRWCVVAPNVPGHESGVRAPCRRALGESDPGAVDRLRRRRHHDPLRDLGGGPGLFGSARAIRAPGHRHHAVRHCRPLPGDRPDRRLPGCYPDPSGTCVAGAGRDRVHHRRGGRGAGRVALWFGLGDPWSDRLATNQRLDSRFRGNDGAPCPLIRVGDGTRE